MTDQTFTGFSLPDGAWLPPEILQLLPEISTKAELKILIAAIYETMNARGPAVISLGDFEALTGLSRKAVSRGIAAALGRGTIKRHPAAGTYIYHLNCSLAGGTAPAHRDTTPPVGRDSMAPEQAGRGEKKGTTAADRTTTPHVTPETTPHVVHECDIDISNPENQHATGVTTTLPSTDRSQLVREMRRLGVALKVALSIADRYDPAYLGEKLRQCRFAVERKLAQNAPGWFVASVREDWQPPLGYDSNYGLSDEEKRRQYITGEHSDLIQS